MKTKIRYHFVFSPASGEWTARASGVPRVGTVAACGDSPDEALEALREALARVAAELKSPTPVPDGGFLEWDG